MKKGFTLVELVIVIAIVIILSVVSVPIYRGYTERAQMSEGYALLGVILSSQKSYYSEYGNFYCPGNFTTKDSVLGVDATANKYFSLFRVRAETNGAKIDFSAHAKMPQNLSTAWGFLALRFNITSGVGFWESAS